MAEQARGQYVVSLLRNMSHLVCKPSLRPCYAQRTNNLGGRKTRSASVCHVIVEDGTTVHRKTYPYRHHNDVLPPLVATLNAVPKPSPTEASSKHHLQALARQDTDPASFSSQPLDRDIFLPQYYPQGIDTNEKGDASKNCAYEAPEGDSNQDHSALCDAGDP
ncbi:hypothetical protein B0J11DRAFT_530002, partial [Dendryphion nanum]